MNIVERAAELLGPIERQALTPAPSELHSIQRMFGERTEPALPDASEFARSLKALERTVGTSGEHLSQLLTPGILEPVAKAGPEGSTSAAKTTRMLSVDRDQLRRQSIVIPDGERTPNTESFRRIKRQILANVAKSKVGVPSNLVLITSALAGEGKTFCAINLAISIALEMDHTVLLVDGDVARPSVSRMLGLNVAQGLMDVLLDHRIELADVLWKTDLGKLTLLPVGAGHQHATELLASDAMRSLLQEMAERYHDRIIIFDSPPLLAASEAGELASQMGQIVMVVEAGKTTEAAFKAAMGRLELSKVAGLLLNKGASFGPGYNYRYDG
jgi:protein-tyrosine kinase